ncbi:N-formylglutamate amidohydrolase [Novosphingopyxis sp. YJ-S2-01]|uniref:N-formylglutamate amidohydrolase n=1 Tax=Novosphingopyxis sp. YJ-S2-01 TaxID=2794021 RepID=UPI0018DE9425|nr:N-formylglutamate amidohydrolase [Novosphingopyxis sp. YJ-S2-01]MBH9537122.1 N-formylglutamate amidohydrolase [Novosphingopyxis sp. YJ-S2-01]
MNRYSPDTTTPDGADWQVQTGEGPIIATAIHSGHRIREELKPYLAIEDKGRLREEDPLTDYFLTVADTSVRANVSRFECDLNRPRDICITRDPAKTWDLRIWDDALPDELMEKSREIHDRFYRAMRRLCDDRIKEHGRILLLDIHSYNFKREGPDGAPAPAEKNPDIDIGATTLNKDVYGDLLDQFAETLGSVPVNGSAPSVGINVRWEDGGNFPEWLHSIYGPDACVMTLEYKKIFMDEWSEEADIFALQHLRQGLLLAVEGARATLRNMAEAGR